MQVCKTTNLEHRTQARASPTCFTFWRQCAQTRHAACGHKWGGGEEKWPGFFGFFLIGVRPPTYWRACLWTLSLNMGMAAGFGSTHTLNYAFLWICRVWGEDVEGLDCGEDAALWLEKFVGVPCRLVFAASQLQKRHLSEIPNGDKWHKMTKAEDQVNPHGLWSVWHVKQQMKHPSLQRSSSFKSGGLFGLRSVLADKRIVPTWLEQATENTGGHEAVQAEHRHWREHCALRRGLCVDVWAKCSRPLPIKENNWPDSYFSLRMTGNTFTSVKPSLTASSRVQGNRNSQLSLNFANSLFAVGRIWRPHSFATPFFCLSDASWRQSVRTREWKTRTASRSRLWKREETRCTLLSLTFIWWIHRNLPSFLKLKIPPFHRYRQKAEVQMSPCFGVNLLLDLQGTIAVGDSVFAVDKEFL